MNTPSAGDAIPFATLATADLVVDREYLGGSQRSMADDPIARLLPVGMLGGFRYKGSRQAPRLVHRHPFEVSGPVQQIHALPPAPRRRCLEATLSRPGCRCCR